MAVNREPTSFDDLPVEIRLAILTSGTWSPESTLNMMLVSKQNHNLIKTHLKPIISNILTPFRDVPYLPIPTTSIKSVLDLQFPPSISISPFTLAFSNEIRRRNALSMLTLTFIFSSCTCSLSFLFQHTAAASQPLCCQACLVQKASPIRAATIRLLWKLYDCVDNAARMTMLENTEQKELCMLYTGLRMIVADFTHSDVRRRQHRETTETEKLQKLKAEDHLLAEECMQVTDTEKDTIRRKIIEEDGHINERVSIFRDLVMEHGCWFLAFLYGHGSGCASANAQTAADIKENALDCISKGVKEVLRPWEEGKDVEESLNSRFEVILASKMECDRSQVGGAVAEIVWRDVFEKK